MGPISGWIVGRMERQLGVRLEYLRTLVAARPRVLGRLMLYLAAAAPRSAAPSRSVHLAALGATLALDCGECVQIGVNLARDAGVPTDVLRAVVVGRPDELGPDDALVVAFGTAVTRGTLEVDELRTRLVERFGEAGAHELALAAAFAQFYPVLKRGLGMARSCQHVTLDLEAA